LEQLSVKRRTKFELIFLVSLWIVAGLGWEAYRYRFHLASWWWHHRHGEVLTIADYVVPAPKNWYVEDVNDDTQVLILLDTQPRLTAAAGAKRLRFTAVVDVHARSWARTSEKVDSWTSFQANDLRKRGVEPVVRKFSFDAEDLSCVGGEKMSHALKTPEFYETDPNLWTCWSSGRLDLRITAADAYMPQVWEIVSQIHKKS
jgi:hypothetical protein